MSGASATQNKYPYQNEPTWSKPERTAARAVFDAVLKRELHETIQEVRRMANQISKPDDLWDLERYLTQHRKDINDRYDFRASRLTRVFGRLLSEGRASEEELRGLGKDKLKVIRSCAEVLSEDPA
jgi:hypothetical protein